MKAKVFSKINSAGYLSHLSIVLLLSLLFSFIKIEASNPEEFNMKIETSAFQNGETIPAKYTCSGENVSPPLNISGAPKETKSFVLIVDDPDAPGGTFDHWLGWNIPGDTQKLPEGVKLPKQGKNSYQKLGYGGPCPPPGKPHRYFFKLYALDTMLSLPEGASKHQIESAMEGHVIAKTELIGTFQRKILDKIGSL